MTAIKKERVEFRISENEKSSLETAAELSNTTVSKFVSESAVVRAREVIEEHKRLQIRSSQWDEVMDALHNPAEPTDLMREIIDMSLEETWQVQVKR
ncbi:type II toxin-antitoxin system TacA family antitoxin [Vibrio penaeicida]|nr:DUF1778 domain-containing protein [Vibrio penaeicida]RTZ23296.1 DUF1778 domain-containing protein [Vibrio penaeicida]